jgi:uncharacterized protein (TIGR00255 family)
LFVAVGPDIKAPSTAEESAALGLASMTGFARAQGEEFGISWIWEIRSVNGRSLDLRLRLAAGFDSLDPELRAELARRFRRGSFSAGLSITRTAPTALRVNRQVLAQLIGLVEELAGSVEAAPPRLDGLLGLRGVVETIEDEPEAIVTERRRAVRDGWVAALDRLAAARAEEGARLEGLLSGQLDEMRSLVTTAEGCAAAQPAAIGLRLRAMLAGLADLAPAMPEERIAQEAALLATRSDVREEIERLHAHLAQAGDLLRQTDAVGRHLDFLCQELNREANTLCSKSADIELTRVGISLKAAVEQFREQVQNVE